MKKTVALLLVILMLLAAFPVTSLANDTPVEAAPAYPSACTLVGDIDLPPIGDQGAVGCCSAMSSTYMQFTNAISRLMHSYFPDIYWNPSSGSKKYIFSPKSVFDYSSGIVENNYRVQSLMGVNTLEHLSYAGSIGYYFEENGRPVKSGARWAVGSDMFHALQYRLIEGDKIATRYNTQQEFRDGALASIKEAINNGNTVCVGTNIGYWQKAPVTGCGTYGKEGDRCAFAGMYSTGMFVGSHFISIVGYDDDIECKVGDVTLKGALLIANSWGTVWENQGYLWVMYDACAKISDFEQLNSMTNDCMYLTETDGKISMVPTELATEADHQEYEFKRVSSKIISYHNYYEGGQLKADSAKYFLYTIQDKKTGLYLAYNKDSSNTYLTPTKSQTCYWAFIPYSNVDDNGKETGIAAWDSFDQSKFDNTYVGGYYVFAANKDTNLTGDNFLDASQDFGTIFRNVNISGFSGGGSPEAKTWVLEGDNVDTTAASFTAKLGIMKGRTQSFKRTDIIGNYYFTEWDKDYKLGYDDVYLKVTFTTDDRSSTYFRALRAEKGSDEFSYKESPIYTSCNATDIDHAFGSNHYLTYSGTLDGAPETVTQYFTFADQGCVENPQDYDWAFQIGVANGRTATLKEAKLVSGSTATEIYDFLGEQTYTHISTNTYKAYTPNWSDKFIASGDDLVLPTRYTVSAELPGGLKLSCYQNLTLNEGEDFFFEVLTNEGALPGEDLKAVYVNGQEISKSGGMYTISAISEDTVLTVDYVAPDMPGDLNGDAALSITDVSLLLAAITQNITDPLYDVSGDGVVSIGDVSALLLMIANS